MTRLLAEGFPRSALVTGDDFSRFVVGGWTAPWLPGAHEQNEVVLRAAATAAGRFAAGGYTVVYDGVVGPWALPAFAAATGVPGLHHVVLLPPEEECVRRVTARTGHGFVDADAARHVHRQFARAHLDERHVLPDPPGPPPAVAGAIRERLDRGTLRHVP